jgi:hypothetical protein
MDHDKTLRAITLGDAGPQIFIPTDHPSFDLQVAQALRESS